MSDFDVVLERLLSDPPFAAALAADPDDALLGYRLDAEEAALLRSQVAADTGGSAAAVETRVSMSSTFGLLSPFGAAGGLSDVLSEVLPGQPGGTAAAGRGAAQAAASLGAASLGAASPGAASPGAADLGAADLGAWSEFGSSEGFGSAPVDGGSAALDASDGFGSAPGHDDSGHDLDAEPAVSGLGDAPRSGLGGAGEPGGDGEQHHGESHSAFAAQARQVAPPKGYENWVDADGDGDGDAHTLRGRSDGGVDILVDINGDGKTDFIGHDVDADRDVDYADYDKDHDGVFEKRMFDDDGDGWLDRTEHLGP